MSAHSRSPDGRSTSRGLSTTLSYPILSSTGPPQGRGSAMSPNSRRERGGSANGHEPPVRFDDRGYGGRGGYEGGSNGSWDDRRGNGNGSMGPGVWDDRRGSGGAPAHMGGYGGGYARRSRSPEFDDRRTKRLRSPSPRRGDGYSDRPAPYGNFGGRPFRPNDNERADYYRDGSDLRSSASYNQHQNTGMDPPESLNYQVTLRYFTDYIRQSQPSLADNKDSLNDAWKRYCNQFMRKGYLRFFDEMRREAWFRERYEPSQEMEDLRIVVKKAGRDGNMQIFLDEAASGSLKDIYLEVGAVPEVNLPAGDDVAMHESTTESTKLNDGSITLAAKNALFISALPPTLLRKDLEDHCREVPGFQYVAISEPAARRKFNRVAWVVFSEAPDLAPALETLGESVIGSFTIRMEISKEMVVQPRIAPSILNASERLKQDLSQIRLIAVHLEKGLGDSRGSVWIEAECEARAEEFSSVDLANKKAMDLYLHYLRTVFHTCYYCVCTFEFAEELEHKCPKHIRRTAISSGENSKEKLEVADWLKNLDAKLPLLGNREALDPRDFGGDSHDEELHRLCQPRIKHEEEGKLRCKECNKLFSALKFIEKHISTKHPEVLGDSLERLKYFNNFVLDPAHLFYADRDEPVVATTSQLKDARTLRDRIGAKVAVESSNGDSYSRGSASRRRDPPPPPPAGVHLDPRAKRGGASYADLDGAPSGVADVVLLPY